MPLPLDEKLARSIRAIPHTASGEFFWYALSAGIATFVFYVALRPLFRRRRISERRPTLAQVGREVFWSLCSIGIFGVTGGLIYFAHLSGWTRFYGPADKHGWPWFFASIALMIALHDTYFYWTHRLMHHRRLYRLFHHTHHLSVSPTPWAAYSFGPLEACVQAGIGPLIVLTMPVNGKAFLAFMLWQISFNVLGHCGHEIFPRWFLDTPFGRFLNTPTHHGLHHEKFKANFGLYFNVWDRLMGTNHRDYERRFRLAAGGDPSPAFAVTIPAAEPAPSPAPVATEV
jgi:sterol desaturase/sphingolipid hydroxylase (fatty acid hydroxylase superfamily)